MVKNCDLLTLERRKLVTSTCSIKSESGERAPPVSLLLFYFPLPFSIPNLRSVIGSCSLLFKQKAKAFLFTRLRRPLIGRLPVSSKASRERVERQERLRWDHQSSISAAGSRRANKSILHHFLNVEVVEFVWILSSRLSSSECGNG